MLLFFLDWQDTLLAWKALAEDQSLGKHSAAIFSCKAYAISAKDDSRTPFDTFVFEVRSSREETLS